MTASLSPPSAVRAVLRVDALAELLIAVGCVVLAVGGLGTAAWVVPSWLGGPVLIVVAVVLVAVAVALWWLSARGDTAALRAVAIANAVTALVFLVWALLGLAAELRVAVLVTAVVLAVLAATQFALGRG